MRMSENYNRTLVIYLCIERISYNIVKVNINKNSKHFSIHNINNQPCL